MLKMNHQVLFIEKPKAQIINHKMDGKVVGGQVYSRKE